MCTGHVGKSNTACKINITIYSLSIGYKCGIRFAWNKKNYDET